MQKDGVSLLDDSIGPAIDALDEKAIDYLQSAIASLITQDWPVDFTAFAEYFNKELSARLDRLRSGKDGTAWPPRLDDWNLIEIAGWQVGSLVLHRLATVGTLENLIDRCIDLSLVYGSGLCIKVAQLAQAQ